MENLGIQLYACETVYSEGEEVSDYEDRDLQGNSDSERVGNTDWCGLEVWMSLSEKECICFHEREILIQNE